MRAHLHLGAMPLLAPAADAPWLAHVRKLIAACAAALAVPATAQVMPPLSAALQVTPLVAAVGVSRQIAITSYWPLGCGPTSATVVTNEVNATRTLVIRLDRPNLGPCAQAIVPYSNVVHYTPGFEGDLLVVVVSSDGELVASQGSLTTRNLPGSYSQFDITGMWYDPNTNGSGLTFIHARTRARNDQVFGTWFLYDVNGSPRWYSLQDFTWKEGGMEAEGNIYETETSSQSCPPTLVGCPATVSRVGILGRVRLTLQSDKVARIFAIGSGGNVLFTSNLVKAGI